MSAPLHHACELLQNEKVLILGSSPNLNIPSDYFDKWKLVCINASGRAVLANNLRSPDLTVFAVSALLKSKPEFDEVRGNLSGLKSKYVFVRFLSGGFLKRMVRTYRAKKMLSYVGYKFDEVWGLSPTDWKSVVREVMGDEHLSLARNISTGVFCVILAVYAKAEKVVTAGIDPNSMGHSYSTTNFKREHANGDIRVLAFLQERYGVEIS